MTDGGARSGFAGILRLVPYSGVQCVDIVMPAVLVSEHVSRFLEETVEADGLKQRVLMPLEPRTIATPDGSGGAAVIVPLDSYEAAAQAIAAQRLLHPITGKPVPPAHILEMTGATAF